MHKNPLAATLAIFMALLDNDSMVLKDKEQVAKVGDYLSKQLVTVVVLVDKSMPTVTALYDTILHGEGGRWRGLGKTSCLVLLVGLPAESHSASWWS